MSDLFPSETLAALEEEYRALRRSGLSHKRAADVIKAAMAKAIPAAVNVIMDEIKQKGMPLDEVKAMAEAGWFDGDPREAREVERHDKADRDE